MMLTNKKNIFIVGIKGVAMANLAIILKKMGKNVTGSDVEEIFITDETLENNSIGYSVGFNPQNVPENTDLIIYSASHGGTENAQVKYAKEKGITIVHQVEILNEIMKLHENRMAVCGTHGKTTTTAIIVYCLKKLGVNPTFMVGTSTVDNFSGGDLGDRKYCVIEADEYGIDPPSDKTPKFQSLNPNVILATNIDFDHPDTYKDIEETKKAFQIFFRKVTGNEGKSSLFVCSDSKELMDAVSQFPRTEYRTYGFDFSSDYVIKNVRTSQDYSQFELFKKDKSIGQFKLSIFGEKNISNATGAITVLLKLGFSASSIKDVIINFKGAKRRFEQVAFTNSIYLFDDYAHHPSEIEATINAVRSRFEGKRLIIIFQPHTYSRTEVLKSQFVNALSKADISFIAPVFASAREKAEGQAVDFANEAKKRGITNIFSYSDKSELFARLKEILRLGDVVFTMGAGDIYKLKNGIIEVIRKI